MSYSDPMEEYDEDPEFPDSDSEEAEFSDQECKASNETRQEIELQNIQRSTNGHSCNVCLKLYSQSSPPRSLPFGHSCCTPCLAKILHNVKNRCCPMCRKLLPNANVYQYVINYALLGVCEDFYNSPWNIDALRRRLKVLSNEHKRILSSAKQVASICMGNMSKISSMESHEKKIQELMEKDDDRINGKEAQKCLDDIETLMFEVEASISTTNSKNGKTLSRNHGYNLKEFNDPKQFITKIYNEVVRGQNLESLCLIDGARKVARVSVQDNVLLLHAFRASREDRLAKHVEFSDLKKCFLQCQTFAFLNLTYTAAGVNHRIFIKNFSQSVLISKFLKLCTGESGPSYLNSRFTSSNVWKSNGNYGLQTVNIVGDEFLHSLDSDEHYYDYISKLTNEHTAVPKATYYLALRPNGSFKIGTSKNLDRKVFTIIGTLFGETDTFSQKFKKTKNGIVIDCGIAVML